MGKGKQIVESKKHLFIVMEYVSHGELLHAILKNKKLPEDKARSIYKGLLSALDYIHKVGVAHRDLKLENLLLDQDNNIKIVDFGLSNFFDPSKKERLRTSCGSPCYVAPELVQGHYYDPTLSDAWSSGIVLFAMVAGFLPFDVIFLRYSGVLGKQKKFVLGFSG